jgi:3-methyladenine DNA glycosylase Mpg
MMTTERRRQKIARDLPALGTTLTGRFKGQTYSATIVEAEDSPTGKAVEYDGKRYTSPSAAAKAITGHSINGWLFWNIMTGD